MEKNLFVNHAQTVEELQCRAMYIIADALHGDRGCVKTEKDGEKKAQAWIDAYKMLFGEAGWNLMMSTLMPLAESLVKVENREWEEYCEKERQRMIEEGIIKVNE